MNGCTKTHSFLFIYLSVCVSSMKINFKKYILITFKYDKGASYHCLFGDEVTKLHNQPFFNYIERTII